MPIAVPGVVRWSDCLPGSRVRDCFHGIAAYDLREPEVEHLGMPAPVTKMLAGLMSR